jgi:hypothetical protein
MAKTSLFFRVVLVLVACAWSGQRSARAEDAAVITELSPDKRYEFRKTSAAQDPLNVAELVERKSGKVLLDFAATYGFKDKAINADPLWRSDSKAFAFGYTFPKSGATVVYRKEGDEFKALTLPALPPMKDAKGKEVAEKDYTITSDSVYPIRWQKGGVLVLEEFRIYENGPWETTYRKIVVSVPEKGPLVLKEVKVIEDSQKPNEQK